MPDRAEPETERENVLKLAHKVYDDALGDSFNAKVSVHVVRRLARAVIEMGEERKVVMPVVEEKLGKQRERIQQLEAQLAEMRKWVNLGGAPSGRVCTYDPKDQHDIHGPGATLKDGTDICLIHEEQYLSKKLAEARRLIGTIRQRALKFMPAMWDCDADRWLEETKPK